MFTTNTTTHYSYSKWVALKNGNEEYIFDIYNVNFLDKKSDSKGDYILINFKNRDEIRAPYVEEFFEQLRDYLLNRGKEEEDEEEEKK